MTTAYATMHFVFAREALVEARRDERGQTYLTITKGNTHITVSDTHDELVAALLEWARLAATAPIPD